MYIGMQAMPLNEEIEGSHGESQTCFEVLPGPVSHMFEMANGGEHGKHRFNNHAHIPGFGFAHFQVLGIGLFGVETMICQHNHLVFKRLDQGMKDSVMHIGGGTIPATHQASLVQQATDLAAHYPATVRKTIFSKWTLAINIL